MATTRLQRWALLLAAHNYTIQYRSANDHGNAKGLSRLPLTAQHKDREDAVENGKLVLFLHSQDQCRTRFK